jgi:hypothetical protein
VQAWVRSFALASLILFKPTANNPHEKSAIINEILVLSPLSKLVPCNKKTAHLT